MTSALLPLPFFHPSMCSLAASHARTFPRPESELELKDLARAFGLSSPELLASFDPVSWSLRTSQGSLLQEEQWGECLETLPDSGMWDAGAVYELRSSELPIFESASSLWPTAVAKDDGKTPAAHLAMKQRMGERDGTGANRTAITSLAVKVQQWPTPREAERCQYNSHDDYEALSLRVQNWPTARQEDGESCGNHPGVVDSLTGATKLWFPTPASRDYRTPNKLSYQDRSGTTKGEQLQNFVEHSFPASLQAPQIQDGQPSSESAPTSRQRWATPTASMATMQDQEQAQTAGNSPDRPKYGSLEKRRLNPRFVCWLMGFPLGWTERCKTAPSD
jgi:hypothetical protein